MIVIRGAKVLDPDNEVDGIIRDIWVDGEVIVEPPNTDQDFKVIDARGMIVAPAGVEIHTHVAGAALNSARTLFLGKPEISNALLPPASESARRYLRMGYTTVFDAAMPPFLARQTLADLEEMTRLDGGCYTVMGDHAVLLEALASRNKSRIRDVIAWLLEVSGGYAVKLVNPGSGYLWRSGRMPPALDEPFGLGDLTQRKVIQRMVQVVNALELPHGVHLHAGMLGRPGAWKSFCSTVKALEGQRAHLCHIQFYCYGDDGHGGLTSAAEQVVDCIANYPALTFDVGQVIFGSAMAISADTAALEYLHSLMGGPWISRQFEAEGGSSMLPLSYLQKDPAAAIQWAAGLELILRFPYPGRLFLTTDHPNGGMFTAYPQVISWLMNKAERDEVLNKIHPAAKKWSGLFNLKRELNLSEIIAMTSSGPARALGLSDRGRLSVGARADMRCYKEQADIRAMFSQPAWVMRAGKMIVKDGRISSSISRHRTLVVRPGWDQARRESIHKELAGHLSFSPENYALGSSLERMTFVEVACKSKG